MKSSERFFYTILFCLPVSVLLILEPLNEALIGGFITCVLAQPLLSVIERHYYD